ncbi:MAG: hypothetical protein KAK04_03590, partial [Cyclobacteriaceae bacterium]|nr:hypothetical protein [Cyclobacteriaceae bacterium]
MGIMHPFPLPAWDAYLWSDKKRDLSPDDLIPVSSVIDISNKMDEDGNLTWEVPPGEWIVVRTGTIPTGMRNHPVPKNASGYECDKMSREAVEAHFNGYIGNFLREVPEENREALRHVVIDSYEVGAQNWTPGLEKVFRDRLGYDPIPWLPVLTGRIVGNEDQSNRFLWDLRRLVADLIAENYAHGLQELCHQNGLELWMENYGHWGFPGEFLKYGGRADIVSGEFWFQNPYWDLGSIECRGASSTANTYGLPIVAAEAFTAGFNFRQHPGIMKARGDWAFCQGINHFVLHVYIHQPWKDRKPGINTWFGMSYHRNNTWFEQSRGWIEYLRRCHLMLQQGKHVADVCYFIGEDAPKMTGIQDPALPAGFDFDFINAEVIMDRLTVEDDKLILPDGMQYRILVLPPLKTMRPELLKKIRILISDGAIVIGPPPDRSPSLSNFPIADEEVQLLANEIWGDSNGRNVSERTYGKGKIYYGMDLSQVADKIGLTPDVVSLDSGIIWTHRRNETSDIYFISNQNESEVYTELSFRIENKIPELWY